MLKRPAVQAGLDRLAADKAAKWADRWNQVEDNLYDIAKSPVEDPKGDTVIRAADTLAKITGKVRGEKDTMGSGATFNAPVTILMPSNGREVGNPIFQVEPEADSNKGGTNGE